MQMNSIYYEKRTKEFSLTDRVKKPGNLQCMPHLHRELELVCVFDGETTAYADSVKCELGAGDVYLAFPNQIHFYETHRRERYYLFILKPDLMPELADAFTNFVPDKPVVRGALNEPRMRQLLDQLVRAGTNDALPYREALLHGSLLSFFSELLSRMSLTPLPSGDSDALRAIISYCTQHFSENLSLAILEEKLHLNKYYISHLFSGKLGIRFNDYVNSLRVSEACRYLVNTAGSITEISETVGFNTLRTFNRAFMKQKGVSPSEFRRKESGGKAG